MKIINCDDPLWNKYLSKIPHEKQDVYYTAEYHKAYELNMEGKPQLFVYEHEGNIGIYPFLLNPVPDSDFDQYYDIQSVYGYSGPLTSTDDSEFCLRFENAFLDYGKEAKIIAEFVRFHPLLKNQCLFNHNIDVIPERETVVLDIREDLELLQKNQFSSNGRRDIRVAERKGLTVAVSKESADFAEIYSKTMDRLEAREQLRFGRDYFSVITDMPSSMFFDVLKDNQVIASAIIFIYNDFCHYHLSGSDKVFSSYCPTNLMLWEAIKYAKQNDCKFFHFGGGRTSNPDDSLLRFKSNYSKERAMFYIGKRVHNADVYGALIKKWETRSNKTATTLLEYRNI